MSSRLSLIYLVVLHLGMLALGVYTLRAQPSLLIGLEGALLVSLLIGLSLWRRQRHTRQILADGTAALRDQDYSLRLAEVGVRDVDELIGVYNDLLERIRTERIDKQRQQFFLGLLIESTALGVVTMDFDGQLEQINSWGRRMLGLTSAQLLPQGLSELQHPLAEALTSLGAEEKRLVRLDGNLRYSVESAYFIDRGFKRRFIVINNISGELTKAEVAAYGQVIRMMAHEVNNTTAATRSLLQSLIDTPDLDDAAFRSLASEYLPLLLERGESINAFMARFADVVRLPAPVRTSVAIDELLRRQAQLATPSLEAAGITLSLSLKPVTVLADEALLTQVIVNAITNARESLVQKDSDRRLHMSCDATSLTIADNGPGIDEATQVQLFTPFFSTKPTGQGIGLTLTRDILEGHDFTYSLATDPDGWTRLQVRF